MSTNQLLVFVDVRGPPDASDSQGGGSMNDQEDLSDQSEGESYSYSAPGGEPLSRDPSEPLFDADFQVGKVLEGRLYHIMSSIQYDFVHHRAKLIFFLHQFISVFFGVPCLPLESPSCSPGISCRWHSWPLGVERWPSTFFHVLSLLLCCPSRGPGRNESCIQQQWPPQRPVCTTCWSDGSSAGRFIL